jgi:hypothetical protein
MYVHNSAPSRQYSAIDTPNEPRWKHILSLRAHALGLLSELSGLSWRSSRLKALDRKEREGKNAKDAKKFATSRSGLECLPVAHFEIERASRDALQFANP